MNYLDDLNNQKKKPLNGTRSVQGELVTPPPEKYTAQKALPNETFIDGQKASTSVGRPNPQIAQTQPTLPKPNALTGDLLAQNPTTFNPKSTQGSVIEGQVLRPTLGTQPVVNTVNPLNTGATATQQLTQMAQKPTMPPNNPPVANTGGVSGTTPPAQSITTRIANGASKLGAAMPAIQAGMNASNIMNQEANFANKIHAGSIADPNFGNEVMGSAPQKSFSRTSTPAPKPVTGYPVVGRGGIPVVPEQFITSRAGRIENPAYTQYMANHPQKATVATVQAANNEQININHTPPNYSLSNPKKPQTTYAEQLLNGESPVQPNSNKSRMPTSMNDVTSGTGYIKGGNGAFKDGVGFTQGQGGVLSLSNGKTIDPNVQTVKGSNGGSMSISGVKDPMRGLSAQQDIAVLDKLNAQRESGAISASQASQLYQQYKLSTAPLAQQPQMAMQMMAGHGNIPAAQQLTQDAQQQATAQYQQGTLANQGRTLDTQEANTQYERNTPAQQLANMKAQFELQVASGNPEQMQLGREGLARLSALEPTKLEKMKRKQFDATSGLPLAEEEVFGNPTTGQIYDKGERRKVGDSNFEEGKTYEDSRDGKRYTIKNGVPVPA